MQRQKLWVLRTSYSLYRFSVLLKWSPGYVGTLLIHNFKTYIRRPHLRQMTPRSPPLQRWFVCLFISTQAIFQLSGGCHHCRWQGCKFRPMLGAQGFEQGGIFIVPHLLRHGTLVYTVLCERLAPTFHSGIRTPKRKDHQIFAPTL
jgi:hypothetical protein